MIKADKAQRAAIQARQLLFGGPGEKGEGEVVQRGETNNDVSAFSIYFRVEMTAVFPHKFLHFPRQFWHFFPLFADHIIRRGMAADYVRHQNEQIENLK